MALVILPSASLASPNLREDYGKLPGRPLSCCLLKRYRSSAFGETLNISGGACRQLPRGLQSSRKLPRISLAVGLSSERISKLYTFPFPVRFHSRKSLSLL